MSIDKKYLPYLFCLAVMISLLLFYTAYDKQTKSLEPELLIKVISFQDMQKTLREFNKIFALGSIGLVAVSFLLGPLSRLWPDIFQKYLYWRKPVGLIGFGLGLIHGIYSAVEFYKLDINKMIFENTKQLGIVSGILGLFIFILMAITSNKKSIEVLGYNKWKQLQTTGYIALALVIVHFFILETKPDIGLDVRPYGMLFFYIPVLAVLARLILIFIRTDQKSAYEHHFGQNNVDKKKTDNKLAKKTTKKTKT